MQVEFVTIMEFIVIGVVAIELYALYNHTKLEHRIDEHILETDRHLEKYNVMIQLLSNNISKLDERMNKIDEHMTRYDEHMNKIDEHMTRYDEHMNKIDEHMTRLDEHINKLDDFLWKSYIQRTENINDPRIQK